MLVSSPAVALVAEGRSAPEIIGAAWINNPPLTMEASSGRDSSPDDLAPTWGHRPWRDGLARERRPNRMTDRWCRSEGRMRLRSVSRRGATSAEAIERGPILRRAGTSWLAACGEPLHVPCDMRATDAVAFQGPWDDAKVTGSSPGRYRVVSTEEDLQALRAGHAFGDEGAVD